MTILISVTVGLFSFLNLIRLLVAGECKMTDPRSRGERAGLGNR